MEPLLFDLPLAQAENRLGHLGQAARIDHLTYEDGPARGSRLLRVRTGGGLAFDVHPDRALDIGQIEYKGVQLAWLSPTQIAHPALFDADGDRFLRTFGGGFLTTCGLDHFGGPCKDDGQDFGQHGRVGAIPASLTRASIDSDGIIVEGTVRQTAALKEHIKLKRRLHADVGGTRLTIRDTVSNLAERDQPHMILYHCNLGWPLVSEQSQLDISTAEPVAITPSAQREAHTLLTAPERGYDERVYLHKLKAGQAKVALTNSHLGIKLEMRFDTKTLPGLCQWKMLGQKNYVLGLEPTNTLHLGGRASARAGHHLQILKPGEQVSYEIKINLSASS